MIALLQMLDQAHLSAIDSATKAIEIAPNDAEARLNRAIVLIYSGHHADALKEIEIVRRLSPKAPANVYEYHALALFLSGRDQDALNVLESLKGENRGDLGLEVLAAANARLGRAENAKKFVVSILTQNGAMHRSKTGPLAGFEGRA